MLLSSNDLWKIQVLLPIYQKKKSKIKGKIEKVKIGRRTDKKGKLFVVECVVLQASVCMYICLTHKILSYYINMVVA